LFNRMRQKNGCRLVQTSASSAASTTSTAAASLHVNKEGTGGRSLGAGECADVGNIA